MHDVTAKLRLANEHLSAGRLEQALGVLQRAARQAPRDADVCCMLTFTLAHLGRHEQALFYAQAALESAGEDSNLLTNLGNLLETLGRVEEAEAAFRRAAAADAGHSAAVVGLSALAFRLGRMTEAGALCREGLSRHPGDRKLTSNLAAAVLQSGRAREAVGLLREALAQHPDDVLLATGLAHAMNYAGDVTPEEAGEAHMAYGRLLARRAPVPERARPTDPDPGRRLRVGLLSGDLRGHAVASFIEPVLEHHDRDALEITCYSTAHREDATSARLRGWCARWRQVARESTEGLAGVIRRDGIDVLIELSGHTAGHRLPAMHLRPAPVQVSYAGYPNTTGVTAIDWRIVDGLTACEGASAERPARLEPCCLCWKSPAGAPEPGAGPSADGRGVTFGSFNSPAKIDDLTVALWARVLRATPGSRLLLKHNGTADAGVREDLAARMGEAGVEGSRVLVEPPAAALLEEYRRVDVALDTFPYHGTTTTCEALFMGVPVVSLGGRWAASRAGVTVLTAAGVPELAAADQEEYVATAAGLAADRGRLAALRAELRGRVSTSVLCDGAGFAARFGALVRELWREACGA